MLPSSATYGDGIDPVTGSAMLTQVPSKGLCPTAVAPTKSNRPKISFVMPASQTHCRLGPACSRIKQTGNRAVARIGLRVIFQCRPVHDLSVLDHSLNFPGIADALCGIARDDQQRRPPAGLQAAPLILCL